MRYTGAMFLITIFAATFLLNLFLSLAVASAARKKGRSFSAFFFISFFFSFIIAAIIVAAIAPIDLTSKRVVNRMCPFCDEPISPNAILCKHCGQQVESAEATARGDALNISGQEWLNRFQHGALLMPTFQGRDKEKRIRKTNNSAVWSSFLDENGVYLLNGYYPSSFSDALQGWYICESRWEEGDSYSVAL